MNPALLEERVWFKEWQRGELSVWNYTARIRSIITKENIGSIMAIVPREVYEDLCEIADSFLDLKGDYEIVTVGQGTERKDAPNAIEILKEWRLKMLKKEKLENPEIKASGTTSIFKSDYQPTDFFDAILGLEIEEVQEGRDFFYNLQIDAFQNSNTAFVSSIKITNTDADSLKEVSKMFKRAAKTLKKKQEKNRNEI